MDPANNAAVSLEQVTHTYGQRTALSNLTLHFPAGGIHAVLGPNGGGKSTLFRLLATLMPLQAGRITILGHSLPSAVAEIRHHLGVVFQHPSLDKKLTVTENLLCQAALYGIGGAEARRRSAAALERFRLTDRAHELCEKLSGGLRRRVELAKCMLHEPRLLLLDEPSTGLDPGARLDLWQTLVRLKEERDVTILLTTHLLEEAAKADRVAILDRGALVAWDTPSGLQSTVGGDTLTLRCDQPARLSAAIQEKFQLPTQTLDEAVRVEIERGHEWIARLVEAFPLDIQEVVLGKPSLEDVFIAKTGHRFQADAEDAK